MSDYPWHKGLYRIDICGQGQGVTGGRGGGLLYLLSPPAEILILFWVVVLGMVLGMVVEGGCGGDFGVVIIYMGSGDKASLNKRKDTGCPVLMRNMLRSAIKS